MPGQVGRSMCTTGYGYGVWASWEHAGYPRRLPGLGVWKQAFRLGKDKEASRLRAIQLSRCRAAPQAQPQQSRGVAAGLVWVAASQP
jgi:hypothetical protein